MRAELAAITVAAFGSGSAAAIGVSPVTGGTEVELDQVESGASALLSLGPAIGALPPNYPPRGKQVLGEAISAKAQESTRSPSSGAIRTIVGPITAPAAIGVRLNGY
ncbi:hypothetical protein OG203_07405 [Nocardia sp. NBC_01499]|uniref:hypothetical protein n=1 Tax=Nocardia sp. NBC_01499 TaxID=2903597 RepID=UPI0038662B2F